MIDTKTEVGAGVGAGPEVVIETSIEDGDMISMTMTINTMILNTNEEITKMIMKFQKKNGDQQLAERI
jgi:hypothetical protein